MSLNYLKLPILVSANTGCASVSAFASLAGIHVGITSSPVRLKMRAKTARIKKM